MNTLRIVTFGASLALGFVLTSSVAVSTASAEAPKAAPPKAANNTKAKEKKPTAAAEAPSTSKPVTIQPKDLAWGIDRKKLGEVYDKVIDNDYKPRYQKTQPGPNMDSLDAEVAEKKAEFRRSLIEFNAISNGVDGTPLRPEYTYNNKEAMMSIDRGGKTRYFFFINNKLWKVIDAVKLGEKSPWGKTFEEAAQAMGKAYGVEGRLREPDAAQGRPNREVDWKDSVTQVRGVDWGNDQIAMVFQDAATVAQLPTLRKNKEQPGGNIIDSKVKDAGAKKEEPVAPPPPKGGKGKAKN